MSTKLGKYQWQVESAEIGTSVAPSPPIGDGSSASDLRVGEWLQQIAMLAKKIAPAVTMHPCILAYHSKAQKQR